MPPPTSADPVRTQFRARYFLPRYWLTWIGISFLWLICLMPMTLVLGFGRKLGWIAGRVLKRRRHITRVNLQLCYPELDTAAREQLVDDHFAALGAGVFETGYAAIASDARLSKRGEIMGVEYLDAAMKGGCGVLLLTGHFTTLEMGARYLCINKRPFHAMYRPLNDELLDYFMRRWRERRSLLPALPKSDLKKLVRTLREGRCIWYGPDQSLDKEGAVHVPFFGVSALTLTATSRLASMGRAKVVPYFPAFVNGRYRVTFLPALENFPGVCEVADAARINSILEAGIRLSPAQYFWSHRRFKHTQPGVPNPYSS